MSICITSTIGKPRGSSNVFQKVVPSAKQLGQRHSKMIAQCPYHIFHKSSIKLREGFEDLIDIIKHNPDVITDSERQNCSEHVSSCTVQSNSNCLWYLASKHHIILHDKAKKPIEWYHTQQGSSTQLHAFVLNNWDQEITDFQLTKNVSSHQN